MDLVGRAVVDGEWCHGWIVGDEFCVLSGHVLDGTSVPIRTVPISDVAAFGPPLDGVRIINVMGGFVMPDRPQAAGLAPMWLPKAANFPSGDLSQIPIPSALTGPVQIEAELAVVVGAPLRKASSEEARAAIFGWSVFNDITAAEYGEMGFWAVGKSIDGFTSWGPWIRRDMTEERVMEGLAIMSRINGVETQSGNTRLFKFRPSEMISHISHRISLFPGDVVALGTPYPAPEVIVGDVSVCEVEEIGTLTNTFVADTVELPSAWTGWTVEAAHRD